MFLWWREWCLPEETSGGGASPSLVGAISTHFSNLKIGFLVPFVGCSLLLIFYLVDGRAEKASLARRQVSSPVSLFRSDARACWVC